MNDISEEIRKVVAYPKNVITIKKICHFSPSVALHVHGTVTGASYVYCVVLKMMYEFMEIKVSTVSVNLLKIRQSPS